MPVALAASSWPARGAVAGSEGQVRRTCPEHPLPLHAGMDQELRSSS